MDRMQKRYVNERQRKIPRCLGEGFYGMTKCERGTNLAIRSQLTTTYSVLTLCHGCNYNTVDNHRV